MESIEYQGYIYFYEYKLANNKDICLATKDPKVYINGFYSYSDKDSGDGKAFVVVNHNNPNSDWYVNKYNFKF